MNKQANPTKKSNKKDSLNKDQNAWSRRAVITKEEELPGRTIQSLLNKLVPDKFDKPHLKKSQSQHEKLYTKLLIVCIKRP